MASAVEALDANRGGFSFDLCNRNAFLEAKGMKAPTPMKTGTTIVGLVFKDGVVLGADTRATEGSIVCDKNCEKIHYIARNMYCCGAGTSADTENVTRQISSQLEMHRLATGTEPRVITALTRLKQKLFQYQGHVSAALVLGGVDATGPHIYSVYPHGSTDKLPYATMGSGSLCAMAVFESRYKEDMEEQAAIDLVADAIQAGIFNDLGSGGNVDVCVIKANNQVTYLRSYQKPNERLYASQHAGYAFPRGSTEVLSETKQATFVRRPVVVVESTVTSTSSSSSSSASASSSAAAAPDSMNM